MEPLVLSHVSVMANMSMSLSSMRSHVTVAFPACFTSHTDLAYNKQKDTWRTGDIALSLLRCILVRFCGVIFRLVVNNGGGDG